MSETHISYKTAKALKEFLKESAPKPIKDYMGAIHLYDPECESDGILQGVSVGDDDYPAYQLHDLLSKPFCEAFQKRLEKLGERATPGFIKTAISDAYYYDGEMPAVNALLLRFMRPTP